MKKNVKAILLILVAIISYPIPGVPSTILIIIGLTWLRDKENKINNIKEVKMEENKKNDNEVGKILGEDSLIEEGKPKLQTYTPDSEIREISKIPNTPEVTTYKPKRFSIKFNKKTVLIAVGIIIAIAAFLLIQSTRDCTPNTIDEAILVSAASNAVNEFALQIRQSIIDNGVVNLNINGENLKLSPYTG